MADSDDEEDYIFLGTPLEDCVPHLKGDSTVAVVSSASSRLPVWKQEVTDGQGRKRLHAVASCVLPFELGFTPGDAGLFETVLSRADSLQAITILSGRRYVSGRPRNDFRGGSTGYPKSACQGSICEHFREGWEPSTFKSSRDSRAKYQQNVEDFMDEDEKAELQKSSVETHAQVERTFECAMLPACCG
eukprot:1757600-Pyramimonas_sp.AAC.2